MQSNRGRNILIGVVFFIVIVLVLIFIIKRRPNPSSTLVTPLPTPISSFETELQNTFGITVPTTAVKANLKDVSGGNQIGLVTFDKGTYTVLANLEDPPTGFVYQAWLVRGSLNSNNYDVVSMGQLAVAKGGWIVNYSSSKDLSDHKNIWITLQKYNNKVAEKHILEGSF